jgi:hypothetical protein
MASFDNPAYFVDHLPFKFFEEDAEKRRDSFGKEMTGREFYDNLVGLRKGWEVYWKEFADVCALLESTGKVKVINRRYSSYGLKHLFEKRSDTCRMECPLPPRYTAGSDIKSMTSRRTLFQYIGCRIDAA